MLFSMKFMKKLHLAWKLSILFKNTVTQAKILIATPNQFVTSLIQNQTS